MIIKTLEIRNFRSIVNTRLNLNKLSLFVGLNDVGKSNVLKALNLFFNGQTEDGKPLSFIQDYCKYTPIRKKKAQEIVIELVIQAPENYSGSKDIRWTKTWRKDGIPSNGIVFADGSPLPQRTRLYSWLNKIRFVYVPAVRGTLYFESLLAQLHDTLAETIEHELRDAGEAFISKIKSKTTGMINGINDRLSIKSEIRLPSNLQALFKTLDFSTTEGDHEISLTNRGDGIKTRHIPIILKFMADQLNINKTQGAANINMIWGYEEPENNLEMTVAFKMAQEFIDYSTDIQLLLTTHSPAFYSISTRHTDYTSLFQVSKPGGNPASIALISNLKDVDEQMGLMPFVTPYISEKLEEIFALKSEIADHKSKLAQYTKNLLFVEGDEERMIFSKLLEYENITEIEVSRDSFGCSGVKQQLISWAWLSGFSTIKVLGLFDNDTAGNQEKSKTVKQEQFKSASEALKVKAVAYSIPTHLMNIKTKINLFPIELEEMYSPEVWRHCELEGWLELRAIDELTKFALPDNVTQTIKDKIELLISNEDERLYVYYKIPDKHKDKVAKYLTRLNEENFMQRILPLKEFFNLKIRPFLAS